MKPRRPVLADVAHAVGVSAMTVSNVLNGRPGASEETRRRVRTAAQRLGYTPNRAAQSLAKGRTSVMGLVVHDLTVQYATELVSGVADDLAESGCELLISATYQDASREAERIGRLARGSVDALILVAPVFGDESVAALEVFTAPVVVLDPRRASTCEHPNVVVDNYGGARSGTEHLLGLGHRRIGFIGGDTSFESSAQRQEGHLDAVCLSDADTDPELVVDADFSWFGGFEAGHRLLALEDRPTALMAACDVAALGAIDAARALGLSVPGDLSVVGFDDVPSASQSFPKLTTVRQPLREMGAASARMALGLARGHELPTRRVRFDTELVVRNTTAPLAAVARRGREASCT